MKYRTDARAEVATPFWVIRAQNDLVDESWSGEEGPPTGRKWQDYVQAKRLELACGEAPYLTSRYDVLSKREVPLGRRVGFLDRKLRVVDENATNTGWEKWAFRALEAVFGVEIKVDKVARARENLVKTFVEHYQRRFSELPSVEIVERAQKIVEKNIVVMDVLAETREVIFQQKFEAIVGNPPYHNIGGAGGSNDAPIYQKFVYRMLALKPKYLSLVIPARWFAGGRENLLGEFRKVMTREAGLKELMVYAEAKEVFPWVNLSGGICYFLAKRGYDGECHYVLHEKGKAEQEQRELGKEAVLVREPILAGIVQKVEQMIEEQKLGRVEELISGNTPFGISSDLYVRGRQVPLFISETPEHDVTLLFFDKPRRVRRYIAREDIVKNVDLVDRPKVILPAAGGTGNDRYIIGRPEMFLPPSACSQTYLVAILASETEARNFEKYAGTKFFRALVKASKVSQSAPRRVYHFVPLVELGDESEIDWTASMEEIDQRLYQEYGLDEAEIKYIEEAILYF